MQAVLTSSLNLGIALYWLHFFALFAQKSQKRFMFHTKRHKSQKRFIQAKKRSHC